MCTPSLTSLTQILDNARAEAGDPPLEKPVPVAGGSGGIGVRLRADSDRLSKALESSHLFLIAQVSPEGFVVSGEHGEPFLVQLDADSKYGATCSCPDFRFRGRVKGLCKHCLFVVTKVLGFDAESVSTGAVTAGDVVDRAIERYEATSAGHVAEGATLEDIQLRPGGRKREEVHPVTVGRKPTATRRPPQPGDTCPVCFDPLEDDPSLEWCRYVVLHVIYACSRCV